MGTGSFPGVKCGRGVLLTTHPLLVPPSWKSRAIPLPTILATPVLYRKTLPCNQQDVKFHNLFISVRSCTCFKRFFRPSPGAQNCTYSVRYLSDQYLTLYVLFWAPDDGRKNRLKHVELLTEIKKLWNVASCWLYSATMSLCLSVCDPVLAPKPLMNYHETAFAYKLVKQT